MLNIYPCTTLYELHCHRIVGDAAAGTWHMHEQGVAYLDLKLDNILVVKGTGKITDFGLSSGER